MKHLTLNQITEWLKLFDIHVHYVQSKPRAIRKFADGSIKEVLIIYQAGKWWFANGINQSFKHRECIEDWIKEVKFANLLNFGNLNWFKNELFLPVSLQKLQTKSIKYVSCNHLVHV